MEVSQNLAESYKNQYKSERAEWRNLSAKYKAQNILWLTQDMQFERVLEVGAGDGSILAWLNQAHFAPKLYALEISESGLEKIKEKNLANLQEAQLFDGYHIPYPDNFFDLVICSHVLEHVEFERALLREIKRVSRHQVFEVPIDFSFFVDKKIKHFLSYGHINIYTPALFRFLLLSENFTILKDRYTLLAGDILQMSYPTQPLKRWVIRAKQFLLKIFPTLLKIKPNAYSVLTAKSDKELKIL